MSKPANPNDATPMIKFVAIAVISLVLVVFGSCSLIRCACGGKSLGKYHFKCAKQGCPGEKWSDQKNLTEN